MNKYGKFFKKEKRITSDYFNRFYQFSFFLHKSATTKRKLKQELRHGL